VEAEAAEKYQKLELINGGLSDRRSTEARDLERWLDREFHDLFVRVPIASAGITDTRCHRQHSWRVHARRIREAVVADPEHPVIDELPGIWARFIERCRDAARRRRGGVPAPRRPSGDFPVAA